MLNTDWTTCGRKLLLDGKTIFLRGVNYAPTPIGFPGRLDMLGHHDIYTRDLINLRHMHVNAVKTYDYNTQVDHSGYLDAAYNNNQDPIYTIFSIWIDQSIMMSDVPISSPSFQSLIDQYYQMAKQTSGHPGVIGYSIGGEMNSIMTIHMKSFWDKFNLLSLAVKRGMKENQASKIITTTFVDDGGLSFMMGEQHQAIVDVWGNNVYQTDYPGSVLPGYKRVPSTKPMLVSEYGYPYASNRGEGNEKELSLVGHRIIKETEQMHANYNETDILHEQLVVGGFVFEYSDEWWKAGDNAVHNLGLVRNYEFPLGYLSEEYFGLFRAEKSTHQDQLSARPTVQMLTDIWKHAPLKGEGLEIDVSTCNSDTSNLILQNTEFNYLMKSKTGMENTSNGYFSGTLVMLTLLVSIVLALVVVKTRRRRTLYRSINETSPLSTSKELV